MINIPDNILVSLKNLIKTEKPKVETTIVIRDNNVLYYFNVVPFISFFKFKLTKTENINENHDKHVC